MLKIKNNCVYQNNSSLFLLYKRFIYRCTRILFMNGKLRIEIYIKSFLNLFLIFSFHDL
jgi:hypothetical protein